jgi:hypothetical protein
MVRIMPLPEAIMGFFQIFWIVVQVQSPVVEFGLFRCR